jgi:hypothetical protein
VAAQRRRHETLPEAGDQGASLPDRFLDGREVQGSLVARLRVPHLGDPQGILVLGIVRDHVAQAARHATDALEEDLRQLLPSPLDRHDLPDESVHLGWLSNPVGML